MHRKHQDHTTYIGDAILHTKAVTQNLEEKLITVQDRIELEKRRNEDLIKKNQEEQKRAEEKILEQQEHIQRLERTRYENKLKELEQSFNNEVKSVTKRLDQAYQVKRQYGKRGCVFPMVIWPAFRMGQSTTILTTHPSLLSISHT